MQNVFTQKSIVKGAQDVFAVCDMPGYAALADTVNIAVDERSHCRASNKWYGSKDYATAMAQVLSGDLSNVAASDAILDKIEAEPMLTHVWRNRLDVVGGIPHVPAFLAGHPMNMRRRERVASEQGPLCIFVTLTVSADIDAAVMRKRGVAILALVRMLSNVRPVELYACNSMGGAGYAAHIVTRIDTAPLDLARAAHMLTDTAVVRGLGYGLGRTLCQKHLGKTWDGNWAYGNTETFRKNALAIYSSVTNPNAESMIVAAAHSNDPMVTEPVKWLESMLGMYGNQSEDNAA